jgi:ABC-type phosphate transport system substrate-binding protein
MVKLLVVIVALMFSGPLQADILVIVNAQNTVTRLEKKQVIDLFMGRVSAFPQGGPAQTLDLRPGTPLRADFYRRLTGKSEAQVDAYWATLVFAGRMSPPRQFSDDRQLIAEVQKNKSAIAYVSRQALPAGVKVVMELPRPR